MSERSPNEIERAIGEALRMGTEAEATSTLHEKLDAALDLLSRIDQRLTTLEQRLEKLGKRRKRKA